MLCVVEVSVVYACMQTFIRGVRRSAEVPVLLQMRSSFASPSHCIRLPRLSIIMRLTTTCSAYEYGIQLPPRPLLFQSCLSSATELINAQDWNFENGDDILYWRRRTPTIARMMRNPVVFFMCYYDSLAFCLPPQSVIVGAVPVHSNGEIS